MKRFGPVLLAAALVAALLLPLAAAQPAYAANCNDDHRVMGSNFSLAAGQQLDSNLLVFGGDADIAAGATVNCKIVVVGGNLVLAGTVQQDVVIFGGNADLRSTSEIDGQLVSFGGSVSRAVGAQIKGGESQSFVARGDGAPFGAGIPLLAPVIEFYHNVLQSFFGAVGMGLLALLVVLFWPEQTARVRAAIVNAPGSSGGLGLLTGVAVPVLVLLATITICLIPVGFMAGLLLTAAIAFGWIALGQVVGERLSGALRLVNMSPAVAAALGTALLSLVVTAINWVPCVRWVAPLILGAVGLGAVVLTRFGTQPFFPATPAVPPVVPPGQPVSVRRN